MKMNPLVIHQFLKARSLRRTKTDKADSITIANYLMSVPYKRKFGFIIPHLFIKVTL